MFSWIQRLLGGKEIDDLAVVLSDLFCKHVSQAQTNNMRVVNKAFSYVLAHAIGEKRKQAWGGRVNARLANVFGWRLIERGYPQDFSMRMAKELAVKLTMKNQRADKC